MVSSVSINIVEDKLPAAHVEDKPSTLRSVVVKRDILVVMLVGMDRGRIKKGLPLRKVKKVFRYNPRPSW